MGNSTGGYVVIRFQICIFDILNTADGSRTPSIYRL